MPRAWSCAILHAQFGYLILKNSRNQTSGNTWKRIPTPSDAWIKNYVNQYIESGLERDVMDPEETEAFRHADYALELNALGVVSPDAFRKEYLRGLKRIVPQRFKALGVAL